MTAKEFEQDGSLSQQNSVKAVVSNCETKCWVYSVIRFLGAMNMKGAAPLAIKHGDGRREFAAERLVTSRSWHVRQKNKCWRAT
jgi:hypothetical protein